MCQLPRKWQEAEDYKLRHLIVDDIRQRIKGNEIQGRNYDHERFHNDRDVFLRGDELERLEKMFFSSRQPIDGSKQQGKLSKLEQSQEQPAHDSLDNPGGDFDSDSEHYPKELDIANIAWRSVAMRGMGGEGTPKQRLKRWLEGSGYDLSTPEIERIAAVCNWDKSPGRPKSK